VSDSPESEPTPRLAAFGEVSGRGWLAAAVAAIPAGLRAAGLGAPFADSWLIAAAVGSCVLVPVAWLVPRAARGFRGVVGRNAVGSLASAAALWASFSAVALGVLGAILHDKTHHRGLGGAAFGIVGVAVLLGAAIAAWRLVDVGERLRAKGTPKAWLAAVPALAALVAVAVSASPLVRGGAEGAPLRAGALDVLIFITLGALAFSSRLPDALRRALAVVGLPLAAFTVIAGSVRVESSSATRLVSQSGGVAGAVLGVLERWSDRDGDGHGAHFGGNDCDEGAPARHPGAEEVPGDGLDSDCDGQDPPAVERHDGGAPSSTPAASATGAAASANATATSAASGTASEGVPAPSGERPDIIVVTLDTVRADRTSLYGYAKKTTPNLEKLAATGAVFEHAYAVAADTQRALVPMVSGRALSDTPHATGEWPVLDDKPDMLAERLGRAGYRTGAVTSFTWLRRDRGFAQGFEVFDDSAFHDNHPERRVTGARAIDAAIAAHAELAGGDKPLYLWVHLFDAHARYLPHPGLSFGTGDANLYVGEIAYIDRELGRLVEAVGKSARSNRTLWLVHGSHGEAFGEHGSTGHGAQVFDEVLHVPMLVAGVGVKPRRIETAVSVFDVAATVMELAGAQAQGLPGVSLVPALRGDTLVRPAFLAHGNRRVAVIDWPLKLTGFEQKNGKIALTLFDLAADPAEKTDLAKSRPDDTKRLDELRQQRVERTPDEAAPSTSAAPAETAAKPGKPAKPVKPGKAPKPPKPGKR